MNKTYAAVAIAVVSLVTIALRFTPFLLFRRKDPPPVLTRIGRVLPYAIMAMLVVYCMKGISFSAPALWAPQLISAAVTATANEGYHFTGWYCNSALVSSDVTLTVTGGSYADNSLFVARFEKDA